MRAEKLKFSPSKSEMWMNCPGGLQLCATLPRQESSKHAMEGTAAHELAANCLTMGQNADEWIGEVIEVEDSKFKVTENMAENVQVYLDAIRGDMEEEGVPVKCLSVEEKFKTAFGAENITGTNDASFSSPLGKLYVYDYKHGVGTYVEVVENTQLMIYALGALEAANGINFDVEIVIAQPRYRDPEVAPVRRWEIRAEDLLAFRDRVTKSIEACKKKNAPCIPGSWCKKSFCPAQGVCPAVKNQVANVTKGMPIPETLTPVGLQNVLENASLISGWVKAVQAYAKRQAVDLGVQIPGYKLIQKTGNRTWTDELMVENEFEHEFGDKIYDKKVKSPAKLEKIVGKDRVKELVYRPDNGLELVRESARGEAVVASPGAVFKKIEGRK